MDQPAKSITIFLSYCHQNKSFAEKIEADLKNSGISVIRDEHNLKYTDSISEFMKKIRRADYALLLISEPYLRSKNCMFEVGQLLKEQDVWQKLLPVIVDGTKIYSTTERLSYIKHWQEQHQSLKSELQGIDTTNALSSYAELKQLGEIAGFIDEFLARVVDMYHVGYKTLIEQNYKPLFEKLGFTDVTYLVELLAISKIQNPELKAIALDDYQSRFGSNTFYYCIRGNLDKSLGQFRKAAFCYEQALTLDPNNVEALNNYGFLLLQLSTGLDKAKTMLEKALSLQPDMIVALLNLGVVYNLLDQRDLAKVQFERVLELEPANEKAHSNLGEYYKDPRSRDDKKAEFHYKQAMKISPGYFEAVFGYANFLKCNLKKTEEGNKFYRKAKKLDRTGKYRDIINKLMKSDKG